MSLNNLLNLTPFPVNLVMDKSVSEEDSQLHEAKISFLQRKKPNGPPVCSLGQASRLFEDLNVLLTHGFILSYHDLSEDGLISIIQALTTNCGMDTYLFKEDSIQLEKNKIIINRPLFLATNSLDKNINVEKLIQKELEEIKSHENYSCYLEENPNFDLELNILDIKRILLQHNDISLFIQEMIKFKEKVLYKR